MTFTGNATNNNNRMDPAAYIAPLGNVTLQYDSAGNLQFDGAHQYFYDAENRLIQVDGTLPYCTSNGASGSAATACYYYDADGKRVFRTGYTNDNCDNTGKRGYVFDLAGHVIVQTNGSGTDCDLQVYAGDRHFGRQGGGSYFYHSDWLGTVRLINFDQNPTWGSQICTSLPFGDGLTCNSNASNVWHFTGKEHDFESGLDDFGARYDSSSMGRFMSADPVFISADQVLDPQGLNLYAYVRNNPLSLTDPTGLDFYLGCAQEQAGSCQYVQNGDKSGLVQGQMVNGSFQATDIDMNKQGDPSAGYSDQFGNDYTGTFDQNNGVSFTNTATGAASSGSQFIDGSDPTQVNGAQGSAFAGIQGNFFDACGGSCQGRATLTGTADAFRNMKAALTKQGRFATLVDGLSLAHPFIADQWKGGPGGYAHLIKAPGYLMDMHFEGSAPGAGLTGFVLHMAGTVKDIANGNAMQERRLLTPGKDPDEQ